MKRWTVPSIWISTLLCGLLCVACEDDNKDTDATDSETTGATNDSSTSSTTDAQPECAMDDDCSEGLICSNDGMCVAAPSGWAVGGDGTVLRVGPNNGATVHPLDLEVDLNAIACHERTMAWFVGAAGAAGFTDDGGESWTVIDSGTGHTLHDVSAIDPLRVALAGDGGTLLVSDDGLDFSPIPGAAGTLRGVDVSPFRVIAVGEDGVIWRHELGEAAAGPTGQADAPLYAVDFGDHGPHGAAVGADGTLLWSDDGGVNWTPRATGTTLDLKAVQVAQNGAEAVAVGEDGVVVRVQGDDISVAQVAAVDLEALHLDFMGQGAVVGQAGTVLYTWNTGLEFSVIETGLATPINGVDALGDLHW